MSVKFKITLNEEQKQAKELILQNTIGVLHGKAGSGKTLLACQIALDGFLKKEYKQIVITRPTVSKEDIGYLPGDLREKMQPWISPIVTNFYLLYDKFRIDQWLNDGTIEIAPVSFMRGLTFLDACIIVDEAQNITDEQMEMIVTRIGLNSKMIICGDVSQIDLKHKGDSGFRFICDCVDRVPGMVSIELKTNHRNSIVDYLVVEYANKYKEEVSKQKTRKRTTKHIEENEQD